MSWSPEYGKPLAPSEDLKLALNYLRAFGPCRPI